MAKAKKAVTEAVVDARAHRAAEHHAARVAALGFPVEALTEDVLVRVAGPRRGARSVAGARRREVLERTLGIGRRPETMAKVARSLGISQQAVGQVYRTAVQMASRAIADGKEDGS